MSHVGDGAAAGDVLQWNGTTTEFAAGGGGSGTVTHREPITWAAGTVNTVVDLSALGFTTEMLFIEAKWMVQNADGSYFAWFYGLGAVIKDQSSGFWVAIPNFFPSGTQQATTGPAPGALVQSLFSTTDIRFDFTPDAAAPTPLNGELIIIFTPATP